MAKDQEGASARSLAVIGILGDDYVVAEVGWEEHAWLYQADDDRAVWVPLSHVAGQPWAVPDEDGEPPGRVVEAIERAAAALDD